MSIRMPPIWLLVTDDSPRDDQLPCTVVQSKSRQHAVWTSWLPSLSETDRQSVATFFEYGELIEAVDWFPKPS